MLSVFITLYVFNVQVIRLSLKYLRYASEESEIGVLFSLWDNRIRSLTCLLDCVLRSAIIPHTAVEFQISAGTNVPISLNLIWRERVLVPSVFCRNLSLAQRSGWYHSAIVSAQVLESIVQRMNTLAFSITCFFHLFKSWNVSQHECNFPSVLVWRERLKSSCQSAFLRSIETFTGLSVSRRYLQSALFSSEADLLQIKHVGPTRALVVWRTSNDAFLLLSVHLLWNLLLWNKNRRSCYVFSQ